MNICENDVYDIYDFYDFYDIYEKAMKINTLIPCRRLSVNMYENEKSMKEEKSLCKYL